MTARAAMGTRGQATGAALLLALALLALLSSASVHVQGAMQLSSVGAAEHQARTGVAPMPLSSAAAAATAAAADSDAAASAAPPAPASSPVWNEAALDAELAELAAERALLEVQQEEHPMRRTSTPFLHELRAQAEAEAETDAEVDAEAESEAEAGASAGVEMDLMARVEGPETAREIRERLRPYLHPSDSTSQKLARDLPPLPLVSFAQQRQLRTQHMKHVMEMKYKKQHAAEMAARMDAEADAEADADADAETEAEGESSSRKVASTSSEAVHKSAEDHRAYRFVTLSNGLRAVLVSDPNTTKSAAAIDVGNGYLSDPADLPGLAHFLEHMLFLGTEKFPAENAYADFIESHGGFSNAYTAMENTNYYFDILPHHLSGALERFAQFFISPLLSVNTTEREARAVDSEHSKNLLSDAWRTNRLLQDVANKKHPYSKFGTGCARTLSARPNTEMVAALRRFWDEHYRAGNLILSVLGSESLDQLQAMVDKLFSPVRAAAPEGGKPRPPFAPMKGLSHKDVFNSSVLGSEIFVNTIEDTKFLSLIFPVESQFPSYRKQSLAYVRSLVEQRGAHSLLKQLKSKGWATGVQLGIDAGTSGFATLQFSVDMTLSGSSHVDEITAAFFATLSKIARNGVDKWRYDEMATLANLTFTYKDKEQPSGYISKLASNLRHYPSGDLLVAGRLFGDYDAKHIRHILASMNPGNMIMLVGGKELNHAMRFREQWYGVEYDVVRISNKRMKYLKQARGSSSPPKGWKFALPKPSPFIPRNLAVAPPLLNPVPRPIILSESAGTGNSSGASRLWYSEDLEFRRPHGHAVFRMYVPSIYASARNYLLTNIYVNLLEDQVDEDLYAALLAGFSSHFRVGTTYLDLIFQGYNQGLVEYGRSVARLMNPAAGFRPDPRRFEVYKETLLSSYLNKKYDAPHRQSSLLLNSLLDPKTISHYDLVRTLETIQFEEVRAWPRVLMSDMSLEAYVHGNVAPEAAKQLLSIFTQALPFRTTSASFANVPSRNHYVPRPRVGQLKEDVAVSMQAPNPEETNSAVVKYWQYGMGGIEGKLYAQLLALIAQKPIFHQLRTREQLGYIVWSSADHRLDVSGFKVQVQSGRRPAHYLSERIDAFMAQFQHTLLSMTQQQFEVYIETLMMSKLQSPVSMAVQTAWFWNEISKQEYVFQRREIELYLLNSTQIINRPGFHSFVQKMFYISDPANPGVEACELRAGGAISVRVESPKPQEQIANAGEAKVATNAAAATAPAAAAAAPVAAAAKKPQAKSLLESEASADMEAEADAEAEAEVDAEAEVEVDVDSETEAEMEAEADTSMDAELEQLLSSSDSVQAELEADNYLGAEEATRLEAEDLLMGADDAGSFIELSADMELDAEMEAEAEMEHAPHGSAAADTHAHEHDHSHAPLHADDQHDLPHARAQAARKGGKKQKKKKGGLFSRAHAAAGKSVSVASLDQPVLILTRAREGNSYLLNVTQSTLHMFTDSLMLFPRNRYEEPPAVTKWSNEKPLPTEQQDREEARRHDEEAKRDAREAEADRLQMIADKKEEEEKKIKAAQQMQRQKQAAAARRQPIRSKKAPARVVRKTVAAKKNSK